MLERCTSTLFAGEWYLLQKDEAHAREAFQAAAQRCMVKGTAMYRIYAGAAELELSRIKQR